MKLTRMLKYFTTFYLVIISLLLNAQDEILNDAEYPEAEFHVAMNPLDTNNIILATMHGFNDEETNKIIIYYTNDYGNTWNISDYNGIPDTGNYDGSGDPVLAFNNQGTAYFVNLSISELTWVNTLASKSVDGGATWDFIDVVKAGFTDKPWMTIDRSNTSQYNGNIYIQFVEDNIKMFTFDNQFNLLHSAVVPRGEHLPSVATNANGNIYCSGVGMGNPNRVFVSKSTDGGETFDGYTEVVSFPDYTFNAPNISNRFQPTVYLAVDNSGGTFDGRLYLSYTASEEVNEDYFDVFLTYSDDEGDTWSIPKVVNSNNVSMVDQFYSSLYVNDEGVLILDWYDRANYDPGEKMTDFFMGISKDGGETFTEIQLNSVSSDFNHVIPAGNYFGIGEYHQLVATENTAISFWSDGRTNDGDLNIYMAKVSLSDTITSVDELSVITDKISIEAIYPQPVASSFRLKFSVREKTKLSYKIIDNSGGVVYESSGNLYSPGEHTLPVVCNIPSGLHHMIVVSDNGFLKSMKFIKK